MVTDDVADASSLGVFYTTVFTTRRLLCLKGNRLLYGVNIIFVFWRGLVALLQLMLFKPTSVAAHVIFPVVVAIRLAEFNARIVWFLLNVVAVALACCDEVHQEPLGRHHRIWVI